jgi:hypothetical protein
MLIIDGKIVGPCLYNNIYLGLHQKVSSFFGAAWIFWAIFAFISLLTLYLLYHFRVKLSKVRFFAKIFSTLKGVIQGLNTITKIERKWEFMFHTIFIWVNYILMSWVVVYAIKSTSHLDLSDGIFLLVVGGLAMSAPVQSGIGVYHFFISRALMVVYGISLEDGMVYAILTHESQMLLGAVLGIYSFYMLVRKDHSIHPLSPLNEVDSPSPKMGAETQTD